MEQHAAIKLRIYPNKEQISYLNKNFGASRFVYNYFLDLRKKEYLENKTKYSFFDICKKLTELKKQEKYSWLNEVDAVALQRSLYNQQKAYTSFFKGISKFPKFHSKHSNRQSFSTTKITILDDKIKLPKMDPIKYRGNFHLDLKKIHFATISKTSSGHYYISIQGIYNVPEKLEVTNQIGIDLGLTSYLTDSNNQKTNNPRFHKKHLKKLKYLQRQHSKSKRGSKNRERKRIKLAKGYEKVTRSRNYFLHNLSTKLINENQVICLETLSVKKMMRDSYLAQSIADASWFTFTSMLEYKGKWHGRDVIKIDRYFPSSKTCSSCGYIHQNLTLFDRNWTCLSCGAKHDRDHNAAKNILTQGINILSGCEQQSDIKQKHVEPSTPVEVMKHEHSKE